MKKLSVYACIAMLILSGCDKSNSLSPVENVSENISANVEEEEMYTTMSRDGNSNCNSGNDDSEPVFLIIDEESIDNGNAPNFFTAIDVNDQIAAIGQRQILKYFSEHVGDTITLHTGQVGDEGWFAPKTIPQTWINAGPTTYGSMNYLMAGPGLGLGSGSSQEQFLDNIPNVTPLRARGLKMLEGSTVLAIVYDSDISINYSPLKGNLKGANLGVVAFEVIEVKKLLNYSSSSLPKVKIVIKDAAEVNSQALQIFQNAPVPLSSSLPFDITPPNSVPDIDLDDAP